MHNAAQAANSVYSLFLAEPIRREHGPANIHKLLRDGLQHLVTRIGCYRGGVVPLYGLVGLDDAGARSYVRGGGVDGAQLARPLRGGCWTQGGRGGRGEECLGGARTAAHAKGVYEGPHQVPPPHSL